MAARIVTTTSPIHWLARFRRTVSAVSLVAFGVATLTTWSSPYRSLEARATEAVVGLFTSTRLYRNEWHMVHGSRGVWFAVTSVCTSSVLLVPLIAVGAWTAAMPLVKLRVAFAGFATGGIVVVFMSTARLALIGLSWHAWGDASLFVTHDLIGTLVSLVAMATGVGVQLIVTGSWDRGERRIFDDEGATS
jgi:exosortase/archaeosortase family protein